jgi:hypothetical protein
MFSIATLHAFSVSMHLGVVTDGFYSNFSVYAGIHFSDVSTFVLKKHYFFLKVFAVFNFMHWLFAFSYKKIVYGKNMWSLLSVFGLYAVGNNQNYKLRKYREQKNYVYKLTFMSHKNDRVHFCSIKHAFLQNVQCFSLVALYYIQVYSVMCHKESWSESRRAGDYIL